MSPARLLLVFLLLASCCLSGCASSAARRSRPEKTFRVTGYVLDSVSRKPVPGVFVNADDWGNYFGQPQTDKRGHFVLHLPVSRRSQLTHVTVNTVLYEGQAAMPADTASEMTILLRRNNYRLPANASLADLPDTLRMKPYASLANPWPGEELAFLIKNNPAQATDTIRTLFLDVNQLGLSQQDWDTYYLLKAYLANGPEQGPGTELLSGIPIRISRSRTIVPAWKKGQFMFDLREYRIPVSAQGTYISLERVVEAGNFSYPCRICLDTYNPTGPVLRPACTLAENSAWVYTYANGWCPIPPAENPVPLYHQAIQVELVGRK